MYTKNNRKEKKMHGTQSITRKGDRIEPPKRKLDSNLKEAAHLIGIAIELLSYVKRSKVFLRI